MKNVNRSEVIREHLKTCKDKSPTAIVKALRKRGIRVSTGLVSVVKSGRRKRPGSLEKHARMLQKARDFVLVAGGHDEAKKLINLIKRIVS